MQVESTDEGSSTGISPLRMAGVVIGDNCGSEKVAGMTVTSPLFCKVAPPLRMGWVIGIAVVEILPISAPTHGAAISCPGSLSAGLDNVVSKGRHCEASKR